METLATWILLYCLDTIWPEPKEIEEPTPIVVAINE